ncbi:hypothetical protein L1987_36162 [Smallanthus sonchifolius]|uniref:Uncharacterized protein n=1 Tax=Smallanthus sonchifolius TaxID=185202 RepID=A0ACB9HDM8_9ASTR|nr:hypothetical protein L1987_36162 [Smallanthus sonchifolius]
MSSLCGAWASTLLTTTVTRQVRLFSESKRQPLQRLRGGASRANGSLAVTAADDQRLKKGIAEFYDESSGIWENIWGEHMHHGFYDPDAVVQISDHRSAQIRMIEQALLFASIPEDASKKPRSIVDVGCGIGGSSRYLSRKYGAECYGITLSPVQAERAQSLAAAQGLANKFVSELARVAAPGATIIIVTWCHRDLSPTEGSLRREEKKLLDKICDGFYLPAWCSTADYIKLLESLSLKVTYFMFDSILSAPLLAHFELKFRIVAWVKDIKAADWSDNVAPFWPAVIRYRYNLTVSATLVKFKFVRTWVPKEIEGPKKTALCGQLNVLSSVVGVYMLLLSKSRRQ